MVLPVGLSVCTIAALLIAIRGVLVARREAYDAAHKDFIDLKNRVRREIRKDK